MKQIFWIFAALSFLVAGVSYAQDFSESTSPQNPAGMQAPDSTQGALDTRDPFATGISEMPAPGPGGSAPVSSSGVVLEGIAIGSSGKAFAVINGRKYVEGEAKNGVEVLEIEKREVRVQAGGQEKVLSMALQFDRGDSEKEKPVASESMRVSDNSGAALPSSPVSSSYSNSESSVVSSQGGVL